MDWAQVLVIILSVFLAIFLLLGIILAILLIRVTQQIKAVTASAQRTADGIEGIVANITKFSSPGFVMKLVTNQAKKLRKHKEK
ncbi:hypothetical protein A2707_01770 [Candidatus Saccharibacteria bacterium RIFCSPHIGHO2_01_FULL_45_15]|nr:MAG: hypothetical protein A2707_01770 [Candidatus Saccharibacteria bacterium RIFCSPHIGHO2_01_FULL_45_15]OGL27799.1 MAG: hypothetical protein A3C39_04420 [Candidatus Saccharibacteria bacterium RIFCSPHIGHO2_02_FULL_46_12]OGL31688.1 MAG: hypothetical protein A3E76_01070 [Candidatus Saccharibacteria bacterium RIFCSPHIGHO2_12_FULL_44_22]